DGAYDAHENIDPRRESRLDGKGLVRTVSAAAKGQVIVDNHDFAVIAQIHSLKQCIVQRKAKRKCLDALDPGMPHLRPIARTRTWTPRWAARIAACGARRREGPASQL